VNKGIEKNTSVSMNRTRVLFRSSLLDIVGV